VAAKIVFGGAVLSRRCPSPDGPTRKDRKERQKDIQHIDFIGKSFNLSDLSNLFGLSSFGTKRNLHRNWGQQRSGYLNPEV
jgi:hypothetical protein